MIEKLRSCYGTHVFDSIVTIVSILLLIVKEFVVEFQMGFQLCENSQQRYWQRR